VGVTVERARGLALALPQITEQEHHGMASFRVRGEIFATVPDDEHLRVMVEEGEIRAAVSQNPAVFHEFYWGKRLPCLVVDLTGTSPTQLRLLLTEAWLRKAPESLAQQPPDRPGPTTP
jgi:hypothetical protein